MNLYGRGITFAVINIALDKFKAKGGSQYSLCFSANKGHDSEPFLCTLVFVSESERKVLFSIETMWKGKYPEKTSRTELHQQLKGWIVSSKIRIGDVRVFLIPQNPSLVSELLTRCHDYKLKVKGDSPFEWDVESGSNEYIAYFVDVFDTQGNLDYISVDMDQFTPSQYLDATYALVVQERISR